MMILRPNRIRGHAIFVRVDEAELARCKVAANQAHLPITTWARRILLLKADEQKTRAPIQALNARLAKRAKKRARPAPRRRK